jgi:hypothetical protein
MTTQITLPPDTRAVFTPDPAGDMDKVVDALSAMGATLWVYPTGDTSGTEDAANIQAAVTAIGSDCGTIRLAQGTFYVAAGVVTIADPGVYIEGAGRWATIISATGTGDIFRAYTTANYPGSGGGPAGGGMKGFTVDGTNAGAGSAGFHIGDLYNYDLDAGSRHFQGSGSTAWWFDNQYAPNGMEQMHGRIWAETSTTHVRFDVNPAAGYAPAGSFDRTNLKIFIDGKGKGDLVVFSNGAYIFDGELGIYGNTDYGSAEYYCLTLTGPDAYSFTATHASPCVFTAAGSSFANGTPVSLLGASVPGGFTAGTSYFVVSASGDTFELSATYGGSAVNSSGTGSGTVFDSANANYSSINNSVLKIGIECNSTATGSPPTQPGTINFGSQADNAILGCTGIIDFAGNNPFAGASNAQGSFQFDGPVYGDGFLQSSGPLGERAFKYSGGGADGVLANGDEITTRFSAIIEVTTSGNVTGIELQGFDPDNWRTITLMNNGTGTITFAVAGSSNVAGGATNVIQPDSTALFTWNSDLSLWFMAGSPAALPGLALAPSGATGETFPRQEAFAYTNQANGYSSGLVSETVYASAMYLPAGVPLSDITMQVGGTAFTLANVSHGWYALLDSGRVVRAVSADQTSGNWGSPFTPVTLSVAASDYITTYSGLYYVTFCATFTGTPGLFAALTANVGAVGGLAPILAGTSSTGQTTPPTVGTTMGAITSVAGGRFYGYTS